MFAEQKKDFYSVNADIAIEANQQQRNFEYSSRANMIQHEYASLGLSGQYDDSQHPDGYN
jgi:penicillin V acylase-like amidase (Ntn superfamily)